MQFTPPHPNNISPSPPPTPPTIKSTPHQNKNSDPSPPSKDFSEIFNPSFPLPKLEVRVHDLFLEAF